MILKSVIRFDSTDRKLRLFRLIWERGTVGDGSGYSAKFSVALMPRLLSWANKTHTSEWRLVCLGLSLHYQRSYGGRFV